MIYAFAFGFVMGWLTWPLIIWALFRYDRQQMRQQMRRAK
jgi:uncharacterized membrane protein YsdA (DUF1294 family)